MVSASRSFGYVLRAVRAHHPGAAAARSSSRRHVHLGASASPSAAPSAAAAAALLRQGALRRKAVTGGARCLSTESSSGAAAAAPRARGSTLFQRLSSFLAGVGVTSLVGFYFLYQDVKRSTDLVRASLGDITRRLDALEK